MRYSLIILFLLTFIFSSTLRAGDLPERVEFNRDIRPILSENCFFCHGPDRKHQKADLRLDVEESAKEDRGDYRVIVPGKPDQSEIMKRMLSKERFEQMPPKKSGKELSQREIALIRRWIEQGAEYQQHWSYVPPKRPLLPTVDHNSWSENAIDRFILARLEQEQITPSSPAEKTTLIRRLCFDLLGLPPTMEQLERWKDAPLSRIVDELLASPHFGERMAIYWLDLVRYANTVGYHGDQEHSIIPYRDYVIDAFNANKSFDQFTLEQLAGDLLPNATIDQKIATGYNRLLQTTHEGGAQDKEYLAKYAADRVRNISGVWMGATMGCAECHDHKFDPYTQEDFYSLIAFFADVQERGTFKGGNTSPTQRAPEINVLSRIDRQRIAELDQLIAKTQDKSKLAQLKKERQAISKRVRRTMITVSVKPRPIRVLKRGDWMDTSGPLVQPAVPHFLDAVKVKGRATRRDLAKWLTSVNHPQTSRVFVNRLWYLFFGSGLCRSLQDTGSQGEWPTHPALLDWLAVEFVESGWDIKHMVRLIVTSATYQQSSMMREDLQKRDSENRLFARQSRYRLPAEMIRDSALSISELLVHRYGGGSARPYQPKGYYQHLNFPKRRYKEDAGEGQYRRGVYMHWQRQFLHPMLRAFDAPRREECEPRRPISNTPLAALTLLNDPTFVESARALALRVLRTEKDFHSRANYLWQLALSRPINKDEHRALHQLYEKSKVYYQSKKDSAKQLLSVGLSPMPKVDDVVELAVWTTLARAILNLSEFITRN